MTIGAVVGGLTLVNVSEHLLAPPWWVRALEGGALLTWARLDGLTWAQLGLGRKRLVSGVRWGLGAVGVIAGGYAVGVLLPQTRAAFQDDRYHLPVGAALRSAFLVIPVGTVFLEEVAFRSVLWAVLARHLRPWQVLATTSALFGLWHVLPSLHIGTTNRGVADTIGSGGLAVAATVGLTTVGGLAFGELRRRSGSVLASAGAHWATNALGVLFGLLAWHLDPAPATPGQHAMSFSSGG